MDTIKYLGVLFLALYLIIVGLAGVGVNVGFIPPVITGAFALVSGILFLVHFVKCYFGECKTCVKQ